MNNTNKEFPLFPELSEKGNEEAVKLIESFKAKLTSAADDVISELYTDIIPHIESDSWTNYRNDLMSGFTNYNHRKLQAPHDFRKIRQEIYKEYREEIIPDLNQDLVKEVETLKEEIKFMREVERDRRY